MDDKTWIHIAFSVLAGMSTLIMLIGGAYVRKLAQDIDTLRNDHKGILNNCAAESLRQSSLGERTAHLESTTDAMKVDIAYIKSKVDEISNSVGILTGNLNRRQPQ